MDQQVIRNARVSLDGGKANSGLLVNVLKAQIR